MKAFESNIAVLKRSSPAKISKRFVGCVIDFIIVALFAELVFMGLLQIKVELAVISQRAENNYCGVNCGIMDQFASANGKKDYAILIDCATLEYEHIPLNLGDFVLVLANCNKPHNLRESKYNERRDEVETALEILKTKISADNLSQISSDTVERYKDLLGETIYRRAKHVTTECERVAKSVEALKNNDLAGFGRLMYESHDSLKYDYEVTGRELDTLVEAARLQKGCIGSRMTGAGFGGCTVSLVKKICVNEFIENVGQRYRSVIGYDASFYVADIADGIVG